MSKPKTPPTPPYPAYWYSGGKGQAWSVWGDGVLLSKHRSAEAARARVAELEALRPDAGRAALEQGNG